MFLRSFTESGYCSVDVQVQFVLDDAAYVEGMIKAERAVKDVVKSVDLGIERIQLEEFRRKIYTETDPKSVAAFDFRLFTVNLIVKIDGFYIIFRLFLNLAEGNCVGRQIFGLLRRSSVAQR